MHTVWIHPQCSFVTTWLVCSGNSGGLYLGEAAVTKRASTWSRNAVNAMFTACTSVLLSELLILPYLSYLAAWGLIIRYLIRSTHMFCILIFSPIQSHFTTDWQIWHWDSWLCISWILVSCRPHWVTSGQECDWGVGGMQALAKLPFITICPEIQLSVLILPQC